MSEKEKEILESKSNIPTQPTPYPRIVESETELDGVDTDSTVSSSDTEFPYSTRRRHYKKSHHRRRSRSGGRRRRHRRSYSSSRSSSSRSSSRSRSRSRSYSSSRSRSRSSSSSDSSRSSSPRRRSYGRKKYRPSRLPKTPNFWPKNAVNVRSTPFTNTITHPTALISPHAFDSDDMRMGFRRRLQVFLDDPGSSRPAMFFALFIAFLVISSSIGVVVESLKPGGIKKGPDDVAWWMFETVTMLVFLGELMIRCLAHSTSWKQFKKFFFSFSNFIDLVAIVPYLIEVIIAKEEKQFKTFTVFRLFRLIRLLHCYGYSTVLQLSLDAMFIAIKKSTDALLAILFFQFFMIVVFSTLIFFFERGTYSETKGCYIITDAFGNVDCSHFDSIPATFWFVAEVITTVGLGDVYPKTVMGKVLSFPLMLFGLLIIALPSIVLGKNFAEAWLWLKTSGNVQKQALLNAQKQRERLKKKKTKPTKPSKEQPVAKDPRIISTTQLNESEIKKSPVRASAVFDQKSLKLDNVTVLDMGTVDTVPSSQEELRASDEGNEELNGETLQSTTNQPYFVSTEALIQSENQDEILQLVQILVEQFQHHTSVVERLSMQQDELLDTVSNLKKVQLRLVKQQPVKIGESEESERSRSRSRGRSRSRSRTRSRSRSRTRSRSRSRSHSRGRRRSRSRSSSISRGRSHSRSGNRLSRSRSPSPSSRRGRSRS